MSVRTECVNWIKNCFKNNPDGKAMCQDDNYLEYLKGAVAYRLTEGV